jgi:hypothetical protein
MEKNKRVLKVIVSLTLLVFFTYKILGTKTKPMDINNALSKKEDMTMRNKTKVRLK